MRHENCNGNATVQGDRALEALAGRQHNAFHHRQATELGFTRATISRRRAHGIWTRLEPRVFGIARLGCPTRQALMAACLGAGSGSAISHRAAAGVWELDGVDAAPAVELTVPHDSRYGRHIAHRARDLAEVDVQLLGALPVTTVTRTLVDLGAVCTHDELERALESALRGGMSLPRLEWRMAALAKRGRPGIAALREVLARRSPGICATASELETRVVQLLRSSGLEEPVRQFVVRAGSRFVARVDLAYPRLRLAIELDGYRHHSSVAAFGRDRARQNELVLLGWTVLRFTWSDVVDRPHEVLATVAGALAAGSPSRRADPGAGR